VWNLIVAKLRFEFAILAEGCQVTLIAVKAALGLVLHVVSSTEYVIESNIGATDVEVVTNVAVFVHFRCGEIRLERQVGAAVHISPKGPEPEFYLPALRFRW
jgi:hypothetical protein